MIADLTDEALNYIGAIMSTPQYPEWKRNPDGSVETVIDYPTTGLYVAMATADLPVDPVTKSGRFRVRVEAIAKERTR